jgi:hypothetical protein
MKEEGRKVRTKTSTAPFPHTMSDYGEMGGESGVGPDSEGLSSFCAYGPL